jgi:hypothetical protein
MKKISIPKHVQKYMIVAVLIIAVGLGGFFIVRGIIQKKEAHKAFRSDIENVYYYLKQKTKDIYLFSNLKDGDSVALSAWHNTQSTIATQIREYEKMFTQHQKNSIQFEEISLVTDIQEYLKDFSDIASFVSLRIAHPSDFSEAQYQSMKNELDEKLRSFSEKAKTYNIDLR